MLLAFQLTSLCINRRYASRSVTSHITSPQDLLVIVPGTSVSYYIDSRVSLCCFLPSVMNSCDILHRWIKKKSLVKKMTVQRNKEIVITEIEIIRVEYRWNYRRNSWSWNTVANFWVNQICREKNLVKVNFWHKRKGCDE